MSTGWHDQAENAILFSQETLRVSNMFRLMNKKILLGLTGSIAAYKSPDIVRRLREAGAMVRVAMTENAKRFITPLTLQAVSGHPVHDDLFDLQAEAAMGHIELARWADVVLIAPATADCMARLAHGHASDLLTTVSLATEAPLAIAPAMNQGMWHHAMTQANLASLKQKGIAILGPGEGSQACGDVGLGRMLEPDEIVTQLTQLFENPILAGCRLLITAGPTQEPIDPVRYLTNRSSGKMGYALAQAAVEAGAVVTLISGPVHIPKPPVSQFISVKTASEMHAAVMAQIGQCDIFLGVAAVSDYAPKQQALEKMPKTEVEITLEFVRNRDIIREVSALSQKPFIVGFAAETSEVLQRAKHKRLDKNMDIIIANRVGDNEGMEVEENAVTMIGQGLEETWPLMPKRVLANKIMASIAKQYNESHRTAVTLGEMLSS
jgi:phosphopantothenoylcysteine decarboxylase/phosphopantothenate--cysteine ligase